MIKKEIHPVYGIIYTLNREYHREDGPAIEYPSGMKEWYINGQLHRLDGPAIIRSSGNQYWYYYGEHIDCKSQQEFEKLIKLKVFW